MYKVSAQDYHNCFEGFFIQDCSVLSSTRFAFVMRHTEDCAAHDTFEEPLVRKKLVWFTDTGEPGPNGGACLVQHSEQIVTAATTKPGMEALFVNAQGITMAVDRRGHHQEDNIARAWPEEIQKTLCVFRLKTIHKVIYGCGARGLAFYRTGPNAWKYIGTPDASRLCETSNPLNGHFIDIDGFAPDDLYAVGGNGLVWHYDGTTWEHVSFPSNMPLESVCCAGDGQVYIGAQAGTVFRGRDAVWKQIHQGTLTLPYVDMVWHQGAVWCANDYGVWTITDGVVEKALVPDAVALCSGHLSTGDGVLLLGGMYGAAYHDGREWQYLYHDPEAIASLSATEEER